MVERNGLAVEEWCDIVKTSKIKACMEKQGKQFAFNIVMLLGDSLPGRDKQKTLAAMRKLFSQIYRGQKSTGAPSATYGRNNNEPIAEQEEAEQEVERFEKHALVFNVSSLFSIISSLLSRFFLHYRFSLLP